MAYYKRKYTNRQVVQEGILFLKTDGGVPALAELLNMPKSTVYYHINKRLSWIDRGLWLDVRARIDWNKHNKKRRAH